MANDDTLRILFCFWGRRGGGPRYTHELVAAVGSIRGVEVHLSLSRQSELFSTTDALGFPSCHLDTYESGLNFVRSTVRLRRVMQTITQYVRTRRIDFIILTMWHPWWPAIQAAALKSATGLVYVEHDGFTVGGIVGLVRRLGARRRFRRARHVFTLSRYVASRLASECEIDPSLFTVIPHGRFDTVVGLASRGIRRHPGLGNPFQLLFFGRLLPRKGLGLLVDAYRDLALTRPWLRLVIAGSGRPQALGAEVHPPNLQLINRYVTDAEVCALFANSHLVVLPYIVASQSGVAAIAYGAGIPMAATRAGGLPEQVLDGETGVLTEVASAGALAQAMARLIDDPAYYDAIARGVARAAEARFRWEPIAGRMVSTLRALPPQSAPSE